MDKSQTGIKVKKKKRYYLIFLLINNKYVKNVI